MNEHMEKAQRFAAGGCSPSTVFKSPSELQECLRWLLGNLYKAREDAGHYKRRCNEMRNATPQLLADIADVYKKYDFTMRAD